MEAEDLRAQKQFSFIYKRASWCKYQGKAFSGSGSTPHITKEYRKFIEKFIKKHNISTVLDAPCGLWTFSQLIEWRGVDGYVGIDLVKEVVRENRRTVRNLRWDPKRFQFRVMSLTSHALPPSDLVGLSYYLMLYLYQQKKSKNIFDFFQFTNSVSCLSEINCCKSSISKS